MSDVKADIKVMPAGGLGSPDHHYYACPDCGWCGPLRTSTANAEHDGLRHQAIKTEAR
jgi:hypothetical protein